MLNLIRTVSEIHHKTELKAIVMLKKSERVQQILYQLGEVIIFSSKYQVLLIMEALISRDYLILERIVQIC